VPGVRRIVGAFIVAALLAAQQAALEHPLWHVGTADEKSPLCEQHDALGTVLGAIDCAPAVFTQESPVAAAIAASGRAVTWINDSPGFVGQRIAAMVANLGCYMAEIGLANPEDIDTAMELGLNYPRGSIALGEEMSGWSCYQALIAIQDITGEDRYRPTMWLRRRALLGLSLYTPN